MKTITATELNNQLEQDKVILIDVREPAEHRSESIANSHLLPLGKISTDTLPTLTKPIVIYCRSGKRSADACLKLLTNNPDLDVSSLEGGIIAWQQAGYPVKQSGSKVLPLDRQTQIAAGFIAFSGTVLGLLINPILYFIPGFIGAGLMFAGLTGWCGLAKLLAKMPWNR